MGSSAALVNPGGGSRDSNGTEKSGKLARINTQIAAARRQRPAGRIPHGARGVSRGTFLRGMVADFRSTQSSCS
jgi:hypothetical protein